jgi:hypothetical protein
LKTNQPLTINANKEQKPAEKELILLQKIKHLEEQLKQTTTERDNLKIEKAKAEQLAQSEGQRFAETLNKVEFEKQRSDQLEIKLKTAAKLLYQ